MEKAFLPLLKKWAISMDIDVFEDALFTVFGHHQPARGDPGTVNTYGHAALPADKDGARCITYRIPEQSSENTRLFAHHQWDAGVQLADMLANRALGSVHDKRIVELGAGTGLPSFVAAVLGARCVVTDYPDPDILAALRYNAEHVKNQFGAAPFVEGLAWGDTAHEAHICAHGPFDIVMAADVLWMSSQHTHLLHSVCALLKREPSARAIVVAGFHTGRPATARFFEAARAAGLVPDEQAPYGGMYERSVFGEEKAWECDLSDMGDITERAKWVVIAILKWR